MPRSPTCVLRANVNISLNLVVVGLDFFWRRGLRGLQ